MRIASNITQLQPSPVLHPAAGDPTFNGCVAPYFSPSAAFGSRSSTSGNLYGARQLQVGAKFFF
jgi:hypothetical protein